MGALVTASVFASIAWGFAQADDPTTDGKKCDPDEGRGNGSGNDCPRPPAAPAAL